MFIKTHLSLIMFKITKFNVVLLFIINIQYKSWSMSSYIDISVKIHQMLLYAALVTLTYLK